MPVTIEQTKRKIIFGQRELADINPSLSVYDIIRFHASNEPSLTNVDIDGPVNKNGTLVYTVKTRVGNKG